MFCLALYRLQFTKSYDAYKALALGADAVSVGRGILTPLLQQGATGVKEKITKMNEHLLAELI